MEIVIAVLLTYVTAGVAACYVGRTGRWRRKEEVSLPVEFAHPSRVVMLGALCVLRTALWLMIILFWPMWVVDNYIVESKRMKRWKRLDVEEAEFNIQKRAGLTFGSGVGEITCHDCAQKTHVHAFTHGPAAKHITWCAGYQCQLCGKFTTRSDDKDSIFCECGGNLENRKVLFCPGCKSRNLSYRMEYIT